MHESAEVFQRAEAAEIGTTARPASRVPFDIKENFVVWPSLRTGADHRGTSGRPEAAPPSVRSRGHARSRRSLPITQITGANALSLPNRSASVFLSNATFPLGAEPIACFRGTFPCY